MNYDAYRKANFKDPLPEPRYRFRNSFAVTLYFEDFDQAVGYYETVLGPPGYAEGGGTRGWQIGRGWLTLLQGKNGNPSNLEVGLSVQTPEEAEALQAAFIAAGGRGPAPSDQLMYQPVRSCPVVDPFGTEIMIYSPLSGREMHMKATGEFEVDLRPLEPSIGSDKAMAHGRMAIEKTLRGDLEATSQGEMLSIVTDVEGSAGYVALERVSGTLQGRTGTFVLQHFGIMSRGQNRLTLEVVPDSGTGQLARLSGTMEINIDDGRHFYALEYWFV